MGVKKFIEQCQCGDLADRIARDKAAFDTMYSDRSLKSIKYVRGHCKSTEQVLRLLLL